MLLEKSYNSSKEWVIDCSVSPLLGCLKATFRKNESYNYEQKDLYIPLNK